MPTNDTPPKPETDYAIPSSYNAVRCGICGHVGSDVGRPRQGWDFDDRAPIAVCDDVEACLGREREQEVAS